MRSVSRIGKDVESHSGAQGKHFSGHVGRKFVNFAFYNGAFLSALYF